MSSKEFEDLISKGKILLDRLRRQIHDGVDSMPVAERIVMGEDQAWIDAAKHLIEHEYGNNSRQAKEFSERLLKEHSVFDEYIEKHGVLLQGDRGIWIVGKAIGYLSKYQYGVGATNMMKSKEVFIVHGRQHGVRDSIDLFLTKELNLKTRIMDTEPGSLNTLIEKFEKVANKCAFAVVIMTADDDLTDNKTKNKIIRARQNVILEIGYILSRLGRKGNMAILIEKPDIMDIPSDLKGVGYIKITEDMAETKIRLVKELKEAKLLL